MSNDKKVIGGPGVSSTEGGAGTELVVTEEGHRKEYDLIRQQGNLPADEWSDARILAVRSMHASAARNSAELATFLSIAHRHGLDPALNEIQLIPVKGGPKPYAGRDGFLKAASRQPQMYGGISSGVVYPTDDFRVVMRGDDVQVYHEFDPRERTGYPHGAYCVVWDAHGHPTYVYRVFDRCKNMKTPYWSVHYDDAIQNRAVAAGLRRVVPLGGLFIFGEEPIGSTAEIEQQVGKQTRSRLREISAELGLEDGDDDSDPDIPVGPDGRPEEDAVDDLLEEWATKYEVSPQAFKAYAEASGAFPDQLSEWTVDHKVIALQEMRASEGMDFDRELAKKLAERLPDQEDRFELLTEIMNLEDRATLKELIASLYDRLEA